MKKTKRIIGTALATMLLFLNTCVIYAAPSSDGRYLKTDYLGIVEEINATYNSNITLQFFDSGLM